MEIIKRLVNEKNVFSSVILLLLKILFLNVKLFNVSCFPAMHGLS